VPKDESVEIQVGDRIQVDEGGRGLLRFGDRLRVELFRDTELQFSDFKLEAGDSMFLRLKQTFGHTRTTLAESANSHVKLETDFTVITSLVSGSDILLCHDPSALACMVVIDGEVEVSAQNQTLNIKGGEATYISTPDLPATQVAQSVQATVDAQGVIQPTSQPVIQPPENFDDMMKSARILLFEDIVNDPLEYLYVRRTLDAMGLNYKVEPLRLDWA
jgi:hypothetical protein